MVENVHPKLVWERLRTDKQARLVDVRTEAEWAYVGLPDLDETGRDPVLIPWQVFPTMQVNGAFTEHLQQAGLSPDNQLYFLCRSGARSLAAARAAQAAGFAHAYNIIDGFEGPPDEEGHRGQVAGWKAEGLPWRQR
ncbi:MAG: rhodanese-like domain-containing protein [Acetobacteraceae bacterium]|nr:rhodanese-like domain-containing protein [Acetobacteraceae bacterium]